MLDLDALLQRLEKVRNVDIARVLDLPDSRIPDIRRKERALKYEEGVKLIQAFELEQGSVPGALPPAILRLVVLYVAQALGVPPERTQANVEGLAEDLRAFSEFALDPKVRSSLDAAEGFFRAMKAVRRPGAGSEAPPGNDPAKTH